MKQFINVIDEPSFGRDPTSGAIVNLNKEAYKAHMKNKNNQQSLNERLIEVERNVKEIKDMFSIILEKIGK